MPQSITDALPTPPTPGQIPQGMPAQPLSVSGQIAPVLGSALQPPGGSPTTPDSSLTPADAAKAAAESNSFFTDLISQSKTDSEALKKKGQQASASIEANQQKRDSLKTPQPPELTPAPKPTENNPLQNFGSAAGWIAVFGSFLTRAPLTSALNASAGAMNAVKENNAQAFQQKMEEWKVNTENALKLHQFEMDAYKSDLEKLKSGDDSALADIQVTAASFKNDTLQLLAAKGQSDAVIKQITAQNNMADKMAKAADRANQLALAQEDIMSHPEWTAMQKAQRMAMATNAGAMTAGIKNDEKKEENAEKNKPTDSPEVTAKKGQAIIDGLAPNKASPGYGAKNPNRDAAIQWATEHAPKGWSMADSQLDYLGRTQEERSASVIASKTKYATNSLDKALPLLEQASKQVDLSRFTDINQMENFLRTHKSDPKFSAFNTALQTAITDYSALIARSGQSTDSTRSAARDLLNTTMGHGGIQAVIDQMRKESQAQLGAASKTTGRYEGEEIPDAAIEKLKADKSPDREKNFDEIFGRGAAAGVLEDE